LLNAHVQGNFVTYDVLIAVAGTTEMLLPYMTADVEFEIETRQNAWLVPSESLRWWPGDELIADSTERVAPADGAKDLPAPQTGDVASLWVPAGDGRVRSIRVQVGIDDGVQTEVIGDGFREEMPVVVGVIRETTLARIIPSVKTLR
jgi:HlyD family secretion protein